MATNFLSIYTRAMSMLKSPMLSRLQNNDLQTFCIIMNNYLQTAITFYNPNKETAIRLSNITMSEFDSQSFTGDGIQTKYILTGFLVPTTDTIFKVQIAGVVVTNYSYDSTDNSINFTVAPALGSNIDIDWYNNGSFNGNLTNEDITLLSIATCWAWAIQIQNNQLDIDRSLSDTDFKQHAEGTTENAKVNWVKHFEEMFKRELSKADWRPMFRKV